MELFDAEGYGMRPAEAAVADPQQRLLLQCMAEAAASPPQLNHKANRVCLRKHSFLKRSCSLKK